MVGVLDIHHTVIAERLGTGHDIVDIFGQCHRTGHLGHFRRGVGGQRLCGKREYQH